MRNARLGEAQAGIKISRRNINNLRYADDTTLMAESIRELKSLIWSHHFMANRWGTMDWFKIGKGTQSTSCEVPGWMKHKLKSGLPGEILITSDMQMTPPLWQKMKNN